MKKIKAAALIAGASAALALTACSGTDSAGSAPSASVQDDSSAGQVQGNASEGTDSGNGAAGGSGGILIAYFSVPETDGVDTVAGASRVAVDGGVMGNNEYIANLIQQETGGDLFAIETVQEYPGTHDALLEFAYNEMLDDARPELAAQIENLDSYDTIFLGYPIWWDEAPMVISTFLESYDFTGKTIVPFCTSASDSIDNSLHIFGELAPDAVIAEGLTANNEDDIAPWLNSLGY